MSNVSAQRFQRRLSIAPRLDGQHFDALGNQHSGFALDLRPVLQVFNGFHTLGQLHFQACQRFLGKRRTGFGRITLPSQRICQVELAGAEQDLRFFSPFSRYQFLAFAALELIELFLQWLGCTFVTVGQVFVNLRHLLISRFGAQPLANTGRTLA